MLRVLAFMLLIALGGCASPPALEQLWMAIPIPDHFSGSFAPLGSYLDGDSYHRSMKWPIDVFVSIGDYNRLAPAAELRLSRSGGTLAIQIVDTHGAVLLRAFRQVEIETTSFGDAPQVRDPFSSGDEWGHASAVRRVCFLLSRDGSLLLWVREKGTTTEPLLVPLPYSKQYFVKFEKIGPDPSQHPKATQGAVAPGAGARVAPGSAVAHS